METLGRGVRGELGGLRTIEEVLAAARPEAPEAADGAEDPGTDGTEDPAVVALRRAAALRDEALARPAVPGPRAEEHGCR